MSELKLKTTSGGSVALTPEDTSSNITVTVPAEASTLLNEASGAANAVFNPAGTGAVATTVQSKLRETVSVFDFMTAAQIADVQAGTASIDVTAAIQAAVTANLSANGGAVYFPSGTYKITSSINIPFSTGWRIFGQSRGGVKIKQFTNNTPIFRFTADLTHSWKIDELSFDYASQQTASHPNSVAIYFDMGNSAGAFNFRISRCSFFNARRCIALNESYSQINIWGAYVTDCVSGGSVTGAFFSAVCAVAVGQPNLIIRDSYIDCLSATEASIKIAAGDVVKLDGVEFNNGVYSGFNQIDISTSFGVEVSSCKAEVATLVGSISLWSFPQSSVVVQNVKTIGTLGSGGGNGTFIGAATNGSLSVRGMYCEGTRSDGGTFTPYLASSFGFVDGLTVIGSFNRDIRSVFGGVAVPKLETGALTQNKTQTRGDVSVTLTTSDVGVQYFNTTLTANRTCTLPSTGLVDGMEYTVVRYAGTPGAFTLQVSDPLSGKNYTFASSTKGFVTYRAVNGSEWLPIAAGAL